MDAMLKPILSLAGKHNTSVHICAEPDEWHFVDSECVTDINVNIRFQI